MSNRAFDQRWLPALAFVEGAAVLSVELLSARMLAPWYGTGIHVWGAVIGITLACLGAGYFLGGRMARRGITQNGLLTVFLAASAFMLIMPAEAKWLVTVFSDTGPLLSLVIAATFMLSPCLVLFGTAPVLIIHLLAGSEQEPGNTTGKIFSISTLGGITGVLLTGFYIIPALGITVPTILIAAVPGFLSTVLLLINGKILALTYLLVLLFGFHTARSNFKRSKIQVRHFSEGLLGQVLVADVNSGNENSRILFVNRMGQTYIDLNSGKSRWSYVDYTTSICSAYPAGSRVLLLGLGGGSLAKNLVEMLGFDLTSVELDGRMEMLGKKYFGLPPGMKSYTDDARHYLQAFDESFDIIIIDVFKGEVPPPHVLSLECFERAKQLLSEDGLIVINFNGFLEGDEGRAGRSLFNTLDAAGLDPRIIPTFEAPKYRNCLYVCPKNPDLLLQPRLTLNRHGVEINELYLPQSDTRFQNAAVFTDDKPILEQYNMASARIWREEYRKHYTKQFISKGISLFK